MKVLLVCAGGMSTSILMKKLEKYAAEVEKIDFEIAAVGLGAYKDLWQNYDCILMGPQVSYRKDEVVQTCSTIPVDVIKPQDYGIGNCPNIFRQLHAMLG